jgi:hypothetical protein
MGLPDNSVIYVHLYICFGTYITLHVSEKSLPSSWCHDIQYHTSDDGNSFAETCSGVM